VPAPRSISPLPPLRWGRFLGVVFLSVAGFTVSREIDISARARTEIKALNADLERRVAQRTAALGESEGVWRA